MDSTKAKAFLLVDKYKSFSKAAEELSYTPSAVSHIADSLEEELGIKLFNRTKRGVEITEEGVKLKEKFKAFLEAEENLLKSAGLLLKKQKYSLKIGAFSSISLYILPEILQSFKKAYPHIETTILVDDYMHDWIENNTADVIFADEMLGVKNCFTFMEEEFVAVVPENEFKGTDTVDLAELYSHPLIYTEDEALESYVDLSRFKEVIPVKSIENNSALYMVKEGIGVTILPKLVAENFANGIKFLRLIPQKTRTIGILYDKKNHNKACEYFVSHLKKNYGRRG